MGPPGEVNQANCTGVHAFLVDERSLTTLGWMDFHCRCGTGLADQSWGGIPVVVFFGDYIQLPPVLDAPVYNTKSFSPASMHGVLVWQEFNTSVVLKNVIQEEHEKELKDVLSCLREYKASPCQAQWLQQFQRNNLKLTHGAE